MAEGGRYIVDKDGTRTRVDPDSKEHSEYGAPKIAHGKDGTPVHPRSFETSIAPSADAIAQGADTEGRSGPGRSGSGAAPNDTNGKVKGV